MAKKSLTPQKARKMLHEGKAQGHRLTAKQRGLFGAVAGGSSTRYPRRNVRRRTRRR